MLSDLMIAIVISVVGVAPVLAVLWFNWRLAVFGPLGFISLGAFPFGMLAAGGAAWQPGTNPLVVALGCWAVGVVGLLVAYRFVGRTKKERVLGAVVGIALTVWVTAVYPMMEGFWSVIGTPP